MLVGVCGSLGLIFVVLILIVTLITEAQMRKKGHVPIVVHLMNDFFTVYTNSVDVRNRTESDMNTTENVTYEATQYPM